MFLVGISWHIKFANIIKISALLVSMSVAVEKEEKGLNFEKNMFRQAKAFVISALGEFAEICQTKQVIYQQKLLKLSNEMQKWIAIVLCFR